MNARQLIELEAIEARFRLLIEDVRRGDGVAAPSPWRTVKEYATHARVSPDTVRRWVRMGMPHAGQGKLLRLNEEEADTWRKNSGR